MNRIKLEKQFNADELLLINELSKKCNLLTETVKILYSRGLNSIEKIEKFLNADKSNFIDPFYLTGMTELVERVKRAAENGERAVIYGDYDADGICSSTIMHKALSHIGLESYIYIPERVEGYGLSVENIEKIAEEFYPDLFITVDCGISSYKEVEYIKDLGVDIIVTDHHELPDILPDCITVNPKLKGQKYPYDNLCGAGVALKVAYALMGDKANELIDLAAVATVADSVPMLDENRDIVSSGLKMLAKPNARKCFKELLISSKNKEITSQTLAYSIAPRINAAGRMGSAEKALKLLLSNNDFEIKTLAEELNILNTERQKLCDKLYKEAQRMLSEKGAYKNIIVLQAENWNNGFVGIVASKLVEEFYRPVILFVNNNGILKGSARSIDNINIFEAVNAVKYLTEEFGGHSQAAGITIKQENLDKFEDEINNYLNDKYTAKDYIPKISVIDFVNEKFERRFLKELSLLEPFGMQNRNPMFSCEITSANARYLKAESSHLGLDTQVMEMVYFNGGRYFDLLNSNFKKRLVFEPCISMFNGKEYIKGYVKDIDSEYTGSNNEKLSIFRNNILQIASENEVDYEYNNKDIIKEKLKNCINGYGSCFVINDIDNIIEFEEAEKLRKEIYTPILKNLSNMLLISPSRADLSGYKEVIYLDKPMANSIIYNKKIIVNNDVLGYNFINRIDISRERMLEIYSYIKNSENKNGCNSLDLFININPPYQAEEFIFAVEVFSELNLITFIGETTIINKGVKSDLLNSKIYLKVNGIKQINL
jgi:single-stranded-DNA-specific exonuclease